MLFAALAAQDSGATPAVASPRQVAGSMTIADYPPHSLRLEEEGVTEVAFTIGRRGDVASCLVAKSSGFDRLDEASCRVVRGFKFDVSDGQSAWIGRTITKRIRWSIAKREAAKFSGDIRVPVPVAADSRGLMTADAGELQPGRRVNLALYLAVTPTGTVGSCQVRWGSGRGTLDKKACAIATTWTYTPAMKGDVPVQYTMLENFYWAAPDFVAQ